MAEETDPFIQFFFQTIETIVRKEPNGTTLLELLQTVVPTLTAQDVLNSAADRNSAFKTLKLRIHPDKHPSSCRAQTTTLFQEMQEFFSDCCKNLVFVTTASTLSNNRGARDPKCKQASCGEHDNIDETFEEYRRYVRHLYHNVGLSMTCDMDAIKRHYWVSLK
jgi:hypothetical protein